MRPLALLILFALSVTGCGYKTPLVKPKPEAQKPSSPPPAAADAKKSGDDAVKQ